MEACKRFSIHSIDFSSVDFVVNYAKNNNIDVIFPTTVGSINFILKNLDELINSVLRFIVPPSFVLNRLVNKATFYNVMKSYGLDKFIPEVFDDKRSINYPCIVKLPTGSDRKGQQIVEKESDLNDYPDDAIYMEYIKGRTEFAVNILIVRERIVYAQAFEKIVSEDHYILGLGNQAYNKVPSRPIDCELLLNFERVLSLLGCDGFYCIDYKMVNGQPKIFEINPRMGFTNTLFPALLNRSVSEYFAAARATTMGFIKQSHDNNGLQYIVKRYDQCSQEELETFVNFAALARGSRPANLPDIVRRSAYMVFAYYGNQIVGTSGIKLVPESRVWDKAGCPEYRAQYPYEFAFLYVDESWRRKGVSGALIRLSLECVDASKVFLVTHNPYVVKSYLARGYLVTGRPYGTKKWSILRASQGALACE